MTKSPFLYTDMKQVQARMTPVVVQEWIGHVVYSVCQQVYYGNISRTNAELILDISYFEFSDHMKSMYGSGWQEMADRNYNIDRNGD